MKILDKFGRPIPDKQQSGTRWLILRKRTPTAILSLVGVIAGIAAVIGYWTTIRDYVHDIAYPAPRIILATLKDDSLDAIVLVVNQTRSPIRDVYFSIQSSANSKVIQGEGVIWKVEAGEPEKALVAASQGETIPLRTFHFRIATMAPEEHAVFIISIPLNTSNIYFNKIEAHIREFDLYKIPRIVTARSESGPFIKKEVKDMKGELVAKSKWVIQRESSKASKTAPKKDED
jgi:hypothetical protein